MSMPITDDSHETFQEDMRYMRLLMDRIFRTAITHSLRLNDVNDSIVEISNAKPYEWEADVKELDAPARDANGRFVKADDA